MSPNPFVSSAALANSCYGGPDDAGRFVMLPHRKRPPVRAAFVHDLLVGAIGNPAFSCVGARSVIQRGVYRFGFYDDMTVTESQLGLCHDLFTFVHEQDSISNPFSTFLACFEQPHPRDEFHFEALFWQLLQSLHDADAPFHDWDPAVSSDPASPKFSFSFAGRAFFIVSLNPTSQRIARRFAYPTLVFNRHEFFDRMRADGTYGQMQKTNRQREQQLQGTINPNLADFGEASEARQYSGRHVEPDWQCPFIVRQRAALGAQAAQNPV